MIYVYRNLVDGPTCVAVMTPTEFDFMWMHFWDAVVVDSPVENADNSLLKTEEHCLLNYIANSEPTLEELLGGCDCDITSEQMTAIIERKSDHLLFDGEKYMLKPLVKPLDDYYNDANFVESSYSIGHM